ncbi:MAG: hypothetical protein KDC07_00635, partial [Chitinophagaceae bacterium]|nr:hypothetical protein [Chitinophagaceae bacterium]
MLNDVITFKDLSVFPANGSDGIAGLIDRTRTAAGKEYLYKHIKRPPESYEALVQLQGSIRYLADNPDCWPVIITNGTLVMLEKFYESA